MPPALTLSAYDTPAGLLPTGAPADPKQLNPGAKRRAARNPSAGYFPSPSPWFGAGLAALDGNPVFTYLDVPRMVRDPKVRFVQALYKAPFQKCKFVVKAGGTGSDAGDAKVAQFVQTTVERFKRKSLPKLLSRYFRYGWFVGAAEYFVRDGYLRLARVKCVEPRDAQPRVFAAGERRNQFAGFVINNGTVPDNDRFVPIENAMWFGGYEEYGPFYDAPPLMGAFQPWLRKNTRGGAIQNTELAMRKNAGHGGLWRHPPGTSVMGTDENPQVMNNQDIARQLADYHATFGAVVLENTVQPANPQMYEWDWTPPEITTGLEVFLDYEEQLDKQIVEGVGIPLEVAGQGSDSGSGYKGRLISYGGFLDIVTELMELIVGACEPWLRHLIKSNYGDDAWAEVEVVSLSEIAQEEEKRNPAVGSAIGAPSPGLPGDGSAGGGSEASPLQLSVTPAPAPVPDPVLEVLKSLAASVAALTVKQLQPPAPVPAPIELAATVGPEGADPQSKKAALDATQQKLMRSRKATIAQLLAYAMVKKQQEATAAGNPAAAAGSLAALSQMAGDPMSVAKIVGLDAKELSAAAWDELELSWARIEDSRTGTVRAQNTETGRIEYGQRALDKLMKEQGLPHTEKGRTRQAARMEAAGVARKAASGEATAEDLKGFADTLATLKPGDLKQLGAYLEVTLQGVRGGKLTGKKMAAKLLAHVDAQVAKQQPPAPKADPAQDTAPVAKQDTPPVANEPEPAPKVEPEPAPEAEAAPVPEPEAAQAQPEPHAAVRSFADAIDATEGLSAEQRADYKRGLAAATRYMPAKALDAVAANVRERRFYTDGAALAQGIIDTVPPQHRAAVEVRLAGRTPGGAYTPGQGFIHLDGAGTAKTGRHGYAGTVEGVYAHELTHAIDGLKRSVSKSDEWQRAFDAEIRFESDDDAAGGAAPLTTYGGMNPSEGLAEFGRLVYGSDVPHATIAEQFPQATAVFKARGLWPETERTEAGGEKLSEVFSERVELGADGSHADVLKPQPAGAGEPPQPPTETATAAPADEPEPEQPATPPTEAAAPPTEPVTPPTAAPVPPKPAKAPKAKTPAKPKGAEKAKGPEPVQGIGALKKKPGADKKHLEDAVKALPEGEVRDWLETAAHNVAPGTRDMAPEARRRQTVDRLAAAWRDAGGAGAKDAAAHLAEVVKRFGGTFEGEPGAEVPFDGRLHDSGEHSVFTGDRMRFVRPGVRLLRDDEDYVPLKALVEPVGAAPKSEPKSEPPKKTEKELEADADRLLEQPAAPVPDEPKPKRGRGNKSGKSSELDNMRAVLDGLGIDHKKLSKEQIVSQAVKYNTARAAYSAIETADADNANERRLLNLFDRAQKAGEDIPDPAKRKKYLANLGALKLQLTAKRKAADADATDDEGDEKPTTVKDILAQERAVLEKRRAGLKKPK